MDIVTLLDWSRANGIRIHPNLRVLHNDKKGIYVRAASSPILPEQQSRKLLPSPSFTPVLTTERDIRSCFLTTDNEPLCICLPPQDVSCRNPEIRRPVRPFVYNVRPYPSRALRSRCHPYPRLGFVLRTVRPLPIKLIVPYGSTYLQPLY